MRQDLTRAALALALPLCGTAAHAQDSATVSPNENLVTDGVPPIPASIAELTRRYTEYRSAALLDWHPEKREMLISTRFANTPQIHRVTSPGGARTQLTCAQEQFRLLLQQHPDSAPTHILMGEAYDGLGKTPDAISEFQAAEKISPNEPNLHFGLGYLYWKSQQYDQARQQFERELALDPNHAQSLAYLGDIAWKNNQPDDAIPFLQRAIKGNKDLRIAYLDLGAIYLQKKNYKEAQSALSQAVALDPNQPDAHYQLGRLYQAQGNSTAAEEELSKVRELHAKADESLAGKMSHTPPMVDTTETK